MSSGLPISIVEALERLLPRLSEVSTESVPLVASGGRVLGCPLKADRDSPPLDVSAMDGFAARTAEIRQGPLPILGECRIGAPPETLPQGAAMRIFTGSPVPYGADTVVKIEETRVTDEYVATEPSATIQPGDHIRRRGENGKQGRVVLPAGELLSTAAMTTASSVSAGDLEVYRKLRLSVITTGNELIQWNDPAAQAPDAWRLRDSNGPALTAMFSTLPWIEPFVPTHAGDTPEAIADALQQVISTSDAIVLTGGVSKGDHDYVPGVIQHAGGEQLFHGLAIRPGKPIFAAILGQKPVFGLPGNPLSVLVTARRVVAPALRCLAGFSTPIPTLQSVLLQEPGEKSLPLEWHRPVRLTGDRTALPCPIRGSGDVFGAAESDGFVALPPGATGSGPYTFYPWSL